MLPGILNQLGPENLKRMAQHRYKGGGAMDDDVPEVDTFDG
jgi:hypothetical protein